MRFVVAAIIVLLVGKQVVEDYREHQFADELDRYWDDAFKGNNPPRGKLDPEMATLVKMLKLYQDDISHSS